ncbi:ABC transporter ATP-binding protein/permease [Clostridium tagluense]|uniref:ABC transporter ATP-binding protein n=1 Tax=Clostridium tagluense TaxID=360422 RepID=UPI001CF2A3C8|nr:ABC transporter ATP-binding protein [Clostridium tagluense]MCB2314114.1 ABC transporter ATP-binding protein/permease [Clostridium tagluense]MCB2318827.1 ABC transporter ATP-binding protein/permease [Clostridium tagluense]MCB2323837.1 ABC transporter ATP-binding protein/permease [Clostridium tagluense]MCB2328672.1 ABC transporter ATP-binding protein/permease [Clostridium tagluense]MCB2333556.1 ABC transporter ATP-binding protein/permease [Clostridium tagluense]
MDKKIKELKKYGNRLFKTLILMYDSSKLMFFLLIVLSFLSGISTPIILFVWKIIIDYTTMLLKGDTTVIFQIGLFLCLHFVVAAMDALLHQVSNYLQSIFATYVDKNVTDKILTKTQELDLKHFDQSQIYNTIQKASNESFQRSMSILKTLIQIVRNGSSVLGLFVMLFSFSKLCIVICLLSTIPIFYINDKVLNKWYDVFNSRFEKLRFASYLKSLCIKYDNIKELKIFNVSSYMKEQILNIYENNIEEDKKIRKAFLLQNSLIDFVDKILTYLMKCIIIYLSFINKLTIGSLILYIESIDSLKTSLSNTMSMISQTYEDSLYMKSLFELLDIEIASEDKKIIFNPEFEKIEFINVSFKYPETEKYVIKDFSYVFKANKTYALVGLNGSGKTTLIKLVLNLYEASSGEILIDGINIKNINKASLYKCASAIFQDFIKYPFDIRTNITLGNSNIQQEEIIDEAAEFSGAKEFIDKLPYKYNTKLQKEWTQSIDLSLGQWQKLAISRATVKQSSILILDEPTASIDAVAEFEMFNNFKYLKNNKLCILVTHRFASIKIVDKILVLENGMLKETGSHDQLMNKEGVYKKLYSMQADAYKCDLKFIS